ncbi:MAG: acetyltransferase [Microbacteriaceae bacterium]|nr:acetyltransferase [Microbacteriaceae bacterium]
MRAIAVGAVLVYHLTPGVLRGGFLGVDLFFVISGFLITSLLLRERGETGRISLVTFWRRRARRLLPALGLLLLATCSAAWLIGGDVLVGLSRQVLGALTFSSNWLDVTGDRSYFDTTSPELFRNLWSLAVEEQFYAVWPLAVLAFALLPGRVWRLAVVGLLAAASVTAMAVLYVPGGDATRVYYGTDTHSFGLTIGSLVALAAHEWVPQRSAWLRTAPRLAPAVAAIGLAGIGAAMVFLPEDAPFAYRGGLALVSVLGALTIAAAIVPHSPVGRMLDAAPLRWVGERSYGLYLWHWPVFVLVLSALPTWPRSGAGGWALGGIALAITVAAAWFSYRFVEQPVRRHGFRAGLSALVGPLRGVLRGVLRGSLGGATGGLLGGPTGGPTRGLLGGPTRVPRRRIVAATTALAMVAAGLAGTAAAIAANPITSDAQASIEQGLDAIERSGAPGRPSSPDAATPPEQAPPAPLPGGDQITAIGDSVMLASAPELQAAFPGIQIDAVVSRQLAQAPTLLTALMDAGTLRPIVLVGLGTNGPIDRATLDELRALVGPAHQIVMVNVYAPRSWTDGVNTALTSFARRHRDVELANWRDAIAGQLPLLARDQIHPGSEGGRVYAAVVRDALQRLAEIPPLLRPHDYGLAPRPE